MMRMKKVISLIIVIMMLVSLAACGSSSTSNTSSNNTSSDNTSSGETSSGAPAVSNGSWNPDNIRNHTFILAHGLPETSMTGIQYHEFAKAVEELSNGKIKIEERVGGTLVTDTETLDALMDGTIDFCHSMGSYVTGTITDIAPLTVIGYYGGNDWLGEFAEPTYELIESIYADYGIKYLGALAQGNSAIVCTSRQIKEPSDVKGLTFRASGTWVSKTVSAWGGSAVTIGLADLADAFSKKTVDGVTTGLNIIVPFKLYEVAKYITFTTISEGFAGLLMNGQAWDSLNDDEKALITEAGKIFTKKSYEHATNFMNDYKKQIEEYGQNEIHYLTEEEQAKFLEKSFELLDEMQSELGPKGKELVKLLKEINGR